MSARPSSAGAVDDWLATVARVDSRDIRLGLARAERVARALDLPPSIPAVVVGGTNGKGSVCALLESALRASGLRVGCYGSPHLFRFHERIRVDGVEVEDDALLSAFEAVDAARRALDEELTYFEFATLAALWIFARARPDAMILEVGLGGRLDAVNLVDAEVAAITNIALDHIEYLGGTRDSIGREKAGILRRGRAAVCGDKNPPPGFAEAARQIGAEVRYLGADFDFKVASDYAVSPRRPWRFCGRRLAVDLPPPAMPGFCQTQNAAVAVAALEALAEVEARFARRRGRDSQRPARGVFAGAGASYRRVAAACCRCRSQSARGGGARRQSGGDGIFRAHGRRRGDARRKKRRRIFSRARRSSRLLLRFRARRGRLLSVRSVGRSGARGGNRIPRLRRLSDGRRRRAGE